METDMEMGMINENIHSNMSNYWPKPIRYRFLLYNIFSIWSSVETFANEKGNDALLRRTIFG